MALRTWAFLFGFVLLCGLVGAWFGPDVNAGFKDSASVIVFVTFVAVAIERLLEMFWTLLGQAKRFGAWWPLNQIVAAVETVETQTDNLLKPVFDQVQRDLQQFHGTLLGAGDHVKRLQIEQKLNELKSAREHFQARLDSARTLAPGSSRLALITHVGAEAARLLGNAATAGGEMTRDAARSVDKAAEASSIATSVVASFSDNPARRLASVCLGSGAGMFIAGLMGLNLFAAILGQNTRLAGLAGVLITGVIVGLGSNPTHEIVKSLQSYKESRKPLVVGVGESPVMDDGLSMMNASPAPPLPLNPPTAVPAFCPSMPESQFAAPLFPRVSARPFQVFRIRSTD